MASEQPSLWGGTAEPPAWASAPVTRTELTTEPIALWAQRATQAARVTRKPKGSGPNGAMLSVYGSGPVGATCGGCAHIFRVRGHTCNYYKCRKHGVTSGPGTDHRLRWQACKLYARAETSDMETVDAPW